MNTKVKEKSTPFNILKEVIYQTKGKYTDELKLTRSDVVNSLLPERLLPEKVVSMVCGYCSTGCSLDAHIKGDKVVNLTPTKDYTVNLGEACPKGWEALTPLKANDRAVVPLLKNKRGKKEHVSWHTALSIFTGNFKRIQEKYGKESVAFLSTGQIATEEMALLGSLAKFGMGILHGDGNTRQCMATSVVSYKQSFGFDAPPYTYKDFEESDVLVFVGSNLCIAHPIMWERVCMNKNNPKIITVDPRKTETAMASTNHYALNPKSDLYLFYGIANMLIKKGWINSDYINNHTTDFEKFKLHVEHFTPDIVSAKTGLKIEELEEFAGIIHQGKRVSFWWTMGVNQSHEGVRTAQAIINLALMTGNIGRPGTGANSITGQCNAMGSRLFSNTTNLLGGHDFTNSVHREKIAGILSIDENLIPSKNSKAYDQIIEGIARNEIKGLWVIATNPAHSWIHQNGFKEILANLEFLVVQDMYHSTETAQAADLVLPAAAWGEKDGTVINSERRIGLFNKVTNAPGEALSDFYIFKLIAKYWGCEEMFENWETPEDVFKILQKCSKGQPCDITGIKDYKMIAEQNGIQWPYPEGENNISKERRLFEDGKFFTPDQKARFIFENILKLPEAPSKNFPLTLLTGRGTSSQWHTQTRTGKSPVLKKMFPKDIYVEINQDDAEELGLFTTEWVKIISPRAEIKARVSIVPTIKKGQIFLPMHYEDTNKLTFPAFDSYSRQPSYKCSAARLEKLPYYDKESLF